jgi:glycerophosphoryl diester phosphodiesterase
MPLRYILGAMTLKVVLFVFMALAASAQPRILVHGHRGARAVLPENTLPAFEHAIAAGADMIELDLAVTKDNVLVVSHDPAINRKICTGPEGETRIRFMTLAEVRALDCGAKANPEFPKQSAVPGTRIPTLDEALALAPKGSFGFNIETKLDTKKPELAPEPAEFARLLVDAIRRHKIEARVMVQSFDFRALKEIHAIAPDLKLCALYGGLPKDLVKISQEAGGVPIVAPHHMLVTKGKVKKAHKNGLQVVPWTVNTPGAWDKMIKAGVDAIITDDPEALIAHLKSKGLR